VKRIVSALVQDRPGVLNRVASMFRRRGFNIASLAVGHSEKPGYSRMTIVVDNIQDSVVDQVTAQLFNVVEVVEVSDITDQSIVARETALIKVSADAKTRGPIIEILDLFREEIEVAHVATEHVIIEVTGTGEQIDSLLELIRPYGIIEIMRTGTIALVRDGVAPTN
jgi:acetolactate synthase-1/3 small subunit